MLVESVKSLFVTMFYDGQPLSTGTGFLAEAPRGLVLVTNRHNVTGRRQDNNQPLAAHGGVPNSMKVWLPYHPEADIVSWREMVFPLFDHNDQPLWVEHPVLAASADFVALPLPPLKGFANHTYALSAPQRPIKLSPAETVSVVGFPFSLAAGGRFGVWSTGFVASEPALDYNGLPLLLIDCRGRPGQSGSPVIAARHGTVFYADGSMEMIRGVHVEFVGIYSGRINDQSDLGFVWKRAAIDELVSTIA